ncbi:hypothetical protein SETIT_7G051700v2 [Setaria italica]|uniref:Uncharacterized protein n=1 Tax=Setaria italica TaxID=4555 RepID=K3YBG9_SETIT|nr:hypothetical protein SETIT_7G051700v2 [Setaria italica]
MAMRAVGDRREASSAGEALPPLAASRIWCAWYRSLPAGLRICQQLPGTPWRRSTSGPCRIESQTTAG